jgi:hypothetical protein
VGLGGEHMQRHQLLESGFKSVCHSERREESTAASMMLSV